MARPRTASDDEIVDRVAAHLAQRDWPTATWTLAEVAPAAGLSPAGLVKRFGSRSGLLHALGRHWVDSIPEEPSGALPPLDELREFARATFGAQHRSAALASLGDLFADLADETSAALLRDGGERQGRYVAALIRDAELKRAGDPLRAARILLDTMQGGLLRLGAGASGTDVAPDDTIDYFWKLWT
ncbi:TetR/AcrR family transcriptional regulator [Micromonospora sp. MW-13]|uniref:TetR/AcrR family transcriptional regulator n=1 Tax=Micromonospora sp. MW-13 TaxID=2094022 RepID=UPI000E4447B1|nr:TetR/AcrR family transcriptional regulator [Micromonospora sp. MW-13]